MEKVQGSLLDDGGSFLLWFLELWKSGGIGDRWDGGTTVK